jgi:hypothetical protein
MHKLAGRSHTELICSSSMIAGDISSAVIISSGSKVLQNASTLYHFNAVLYPNKEEDWR